MKTFYSDDCLKCLFVDWASNCGLSRVECRLEKRSCVDRKLGPGSCYCPDKVEPPDWCPLPVRVMLVQTNANSSEQVGG